MMDPKNEATWPPCLGIDEMCAILNIKASTLRETRRRKSWPFSEMPRFGRQPRWSREHVIAVLAGYRQSASFRRSA